MNIDKSEPADLHIDYLLVSTGFTTAAGLSSFTDEPVSDDRTTQISKGELFNSAHLRKVSGSLPGRDETDDKCLSIDDSIPEKPYADENKLICRHWNHVKNRSVKGVDFITAFYRHRRGNVPLATGFALKSKIYQASLRAGFMEMDELSVI